MKEEVFTFRHGMRDFARLLAHLAGVALDCDFVVTVGPFKKERSSLQNRALWGLAYKTLHEATGNDPEDLHTYFCGEYFGWTEYDVLGQKRKRPFRTTTRDDRGHHDVISTLQLSDFYAFIQRRAAETVGVYVPDPDPRWWERDRRVA